MLVRLFVEGQFERSLTDAESVIDPENSFAWMLATFPWVLVQLNLAVRLDVFLDL